MPACAGAGDRPGPGSPVAEITTSVFSMQPAGNPGSGALLQEGLTPSRRMAPALAGKPVPSTPKARLPTVGTTPIEALRKVPWLSRG